MVFKLTACPQSSRLFVISFASTHCHHKLLHKHKQGILFHSFFLSSLKRKSNRNPSLKSSTWFERIELFLITYRSVKEENRDSTYKRSRRNKGAQDHTQASTNLHKTKRCNEAKQIVAPNISFQNSLMSTSISLMKIKIPWLNIYKMTDSVAASSLLTAVLSIDPFLFHCWHQWPEMFLLAFNGTKWCYTCTCNSTLPCLSLKLFA